MNITSPTMPRTTSDRLAVRTRSDDVLAIPAALRSEWRPSEATRRSLPARR